MVIAVVVKRHFCHASSFKQASIFLHRRRFERDVGGHGASETVNRRDVYVF